MTSRRKTLLLSSTQNMGIEKPAAKPAEQDELQAAEASSGLEIDSDSAPAAEMSEATMSSYVTWIDLSEEAEVEDQVEPEPQQAPLPAAKIAATEETKDDMDPMQFFKSQPKAALEMEAMLDLDEEVVELEDVVVPVNTVKVPLFSDLVPVEFGDLLSRISVRRVVADTTICREGQRGESIYIIVSGTVEVSAKNETGSQSVVAHLKSGEFFGEFGFTIRW